MTLRELFKLIADAIREKTGETGEIIAKDFPEKIAAIEVGNGSGSGDGGPIITFLSNYPFTNGKTMFSVNTVDGKLTEIPEMAEFEGFFDGFADGGQTRDSLINAHNGAALTITTETIFESDKILLTKTSKGYYLYFKIASSDENIASFLDEQNNEVDILKSEMQRPGVYGRYADINFPELALEENYKVVGWRLNGSLMHPTWFEGPMAESLYLYEDKNFIPNIVNLQDENIVHVIFKVKDYLSQGYNMFNGLITSNEFIKGFEGSVMSQNYKDGYYDSADILGFSEWHVYFDKTGNFTVRDLLGAESIFFAYAYIEIYDETGENLLTTWTDMNNAYEDYSFLENGKTYLLQGDMQWY